MNTYITETITEVIPYDHKPRCLIVMSTYNGKQFVDEQISSIINQVGVTVKLLIRDDGSTDGTCLLLDELKYKYGDKIAVIKGNNVGIHKSFKIAFDYAKTICDFDYLGFSDQDDIWDEDKLLVAVSSLEKYNADFYTSASRLVDEHNIYLGNTTANLAKNKFYMDGNSKLLSSGVQGSTIVITKELYEFLESHNLPDKYGHDTWIPIISYIFFNSIYDANSHMNYRQHNASWTGNRGNKINRFRKEIIHYFQGLSRYRPLSNDILDTFAEELSDIDKTLLKCISGRNLNALQRIKALYSFGFGKYGWKENLVYRMYYIFGF